MSRIKNLCMWMSVILCLFSISGATALELVVNAGSQLRENCPVMVAIENVKLPSGMDKAGKLISSQGEIPCRIIKGEGDKTTLAFIINGLTANEQRVYQLQPGKVETKNSVAIAESGKALDIQIGGKPFTKYVFGGDKFIRPYFYPVLGPGGIGMTRGYPMDFHEGEAKDHPHHFSMWVAHGDVNGTDDWSDKADCGLIKQTKLDFADAGPVCGCFSTHNDWTTREGKKILEDRRVITVWETPDAGRMIDLDLTFSATEGEVKFGDTKEGGLVSLRVAGWLSETQEKGKKGGIITNANGEVGESQAWGKAAPWCDYSGAVGTITAGLSILDHPANPFFPTYYHVRSYGLFTANPFGLSHFKNDKSVNGSRILKPDQPWHCRYRVYIHAGDVKSGKVAEAYRNFADPPKVAVR